MSAVPAKSAVSNSSAKQPLGAVLLEKGIISHDQLRIALIEQKKRNIPLGKILVSLGFVSEATIRDILSENLGQVAIDLSNTVADPAALALIPKEAARRYHVLPVAFIPEENKLITAISDPTDVVALDQIRALVPDSIRVEPMLARESDIIAGIEQYYGFRAFDRRHLARNRNRRNRLRQYSGEFR